MGISRSGFLFAFNDPEPHIRLRALGANQQMALTLASQLSQLCQRALSAGLCWRVVSDSYQREVTRYGGLVAMAECVKILIVDDHRMIIASIVGLLQDTYDICSASSSEAMSSMLEQQRFDLALTDLQLGDDMLSACIGHGTTGFGGAQNPARTKGGTKYFLSRMVRCTSSQTTFILQIVGLLYYNHEISQGSLSGKAKSDASHPVYLVGRASLVD